MIHQAAIPQCSIPCGEQRLRIGRTQFREPAELVAPGQPSQRCRRGGAELDGLRAELTAEAEAQTAGYGRGLALLWPKRIPRAALHGIASVRSITSLRRRNEGVHGGSK